MGRTAIGTLDPMLGAHSTHPTHEETENFPVSY